MELKQINLKKIHDGRGVFRIITKSHEGAFL